MVNFLRKLRRQEEGDQAHKGISTFNEERSQKRIEIENTHHIFYAAPLLRSGVVVIFTPEYYKPVVKEGNWLRIRLPGEERVDVRMRIIGAKHGGTGAMATRPDYFSLLCKIPEATLESTKRNHDRYTTSQYRDILLDLASPVPGAYQVLDVSDQGLKIHIGESGQIERFTLGQYLQKGHLRLGAKAKVELIDLIPRAHFQDSVGLEINTSPQGPYRNIMEKFLKSLKSRSMRVTAEDSN